MQITPISEINKNVYNTRPKQVGFGNKYTTRFYEIRTKCTLNDIANAYKYKGNINELNDILRPFKIDIIDFILMMPPMRTLDKDFIAIVTRSPSFKLLVDDYKEYMKLTENGLYPEREK
jgi:hypothetical protein